MSQFEKKLEEGRKGEIFISDWLKSEGWGVIPTFDYSGKNGEKAPKLQFMSDGLIIPDLDICKAGDRVWLEIKTYHGPAYNRKIAAHVHGIAVRLYNHYMRVEKETGCRVLIGILERDSKKFLVARLAKLRSFKCQCKNCSAGNDLYCNAPPGMKRLMYWRRDEMQCIKTFDIIP